MGEPPSTPPIAGETGRRTLGELIHAAVRGAIEAAVEAEVVATLGTGRSERRDSRQDDRNGTQTGRLSGPTGATRGPSSWIRRARAAPWSTDSGWAATRAAAACPLHDGDVILVGTSLSPPVFTFRVP